MCRLAAYLGSPITLSEFLLTPEHSLIRQSWAPQEMQEGTINADGFGFAWFNNNQPCKYKNTLPIWSDTNLNDLAHSLSSNLWLANVRSATPGQGLSEANTQPFIKDKIIFIHNGCLNPFTKNEKASLLEQLSTDVRAEINGDSDSLYLFALLQQHQRIHSNLPDAIMAMLQELSRIYHGKLLLNIIISDGDLLYACRHAVNASCPSLYYCQSTDHQGQDNIKIASEPLTQDEAWITFPEHYLIRFNHLGLLDRHAL